MRARASLSAESRAALRSDLAFGGGVLFARGIGQALRLAPARARLRLGCGGGGERGLRGLERWRFAVDLGARGLEFAVDRRKAAALGEPARRAGRRVRGGDKAVPAPEIAFARDQPLAGLEQRRKLRPVGAVDDADLRQTARQLRRRLHVLRQRLAPSGSAGSADRRVAPAQCIGAEASTGASRSSPSAAPSAFS